MPAVSSSQVSSQTALLPRHSNAAAEQDMEEVSSRPTQQAAPVGTNAAFQHHNSNAGSTQDAFSVPSHLQPMQVTFQCLHPLTVLQSKVLGINKLTGSRLE